MTLHDRHRELLVAVGAVGMRLRPTPRPAEDMLRARTRPLSEHTWVDALEVCGRLVAFQTSGYLLSYNLPGNQFRNVLFELWDKAAPSS